MQRIKPLFVLLMLLCAALVFCGCDSHPDPVSTVEDDPENEAPNVIENQVFNLNGEDSGEGFKSVRYYTVDVDSCSITGAYFALGISDEITPELVLSFLADSLDDSSVHIGFDSIEVENGTCVVSFDDGMLAFADNPKLEDAILDAAAQSLLDTVAECKRIVFRINGEAYTTSNNSFGINEIYME